MIPHRGFYRHYKGGIYFVHGIAENHDGGPDLVIYESLQGVNKLPQRMCYRTVEKFEEMIIAGETPGGRIVRERRFMRLSHSPGPSPLDVACTCGAESGEPCQEAFGWPRPKSGEYHPARFETFAQRARR